MGTKKHLTVYFLKGLPASGKCLTKNNYIPSSKGMVPINQLETGDTVFTGNREAAITQTFTRVVDSYTRVNVKNSHFIEATTEHPVYVFDTESFAWGFIPVRDLDTSRHLLCIPSTKGIFPETYQTVQYTYKRNPQDRNSKEVKFPTYLSEDLSSFLGYCVANSVVDKYGISFSSRNDRLKSDFNHKVYGLFGIHGSYQERGVRVCSVRVKRFLEHLNGETWKTARFKTVPEIVKRSPVNVQKAFIRSLFDCDSHLSRERHSIEFSTASVSVAHDISRMLLNFGIYNAIRSKYLRKYDHTYFSINLYGGFVSLYLEIFGSNKYNSEEVLTQRKAKREHTNCFVAVGFYNLLYDTLQQERKRLGVNRGGFYHVDGSAVLFIPPSNYIRHFPKGVSENKSPTYKTLKEIIEDIEFHLDKFPYLEECLVQGKRMLENKYHLLPIDSIEEVNEQTEVYDIEVEGEHCFVANGMIVHNSTWAKQKIEEDRRKGIHTKRVNKDDLRAMLDDSAWSKTNEQFVLDIRDDIIFEALRQGYNVIVDDTNFELKHKKAVEALIELINQTDTASGSRAGEGNSVSLEEIYFDVPLHTCIERDRLRVNPVGERVIRNMYNWYVGKRETVPYVPYDPSLPECIVCDVDGTLAVKGDRSPFDYWSAIDDTLNEPVADLLYSLVSSPENHGEKRPVVIIMTGRENLCDEDGYTVSDLTQKWLNQNKILYDSIFIRKEGDHRPDYVVKKELYEQHIKGVYNVLYWIDDRRQVVDAMRSEGLVVIDVAGHDF